MFSEFVERNYAFSPIRIQIHKNISLKFEILFIGSCKKSTWSHIDRHVFWIRRAKLHNFAHTNSENIHIDMWLSWFFYRVTKKKLKFIWVFFWVFCESQNGSHMEQFFFWIRHGAVKTIKWSRDPRLYANNFSKYWLLSKVNSCTNSHVGYPWLRAGILSLSLSL